ncbi:MAG: hypothetical protein E6I38_01775 [Chloroflexi bacterium]|nr:MAG: hypothetical protein E6I38_01775 [Chloroflexota bacterium]
MNEEERADWLARAIDDLLSSDRSRPKEPSPPKFERQELNALLRIANARAERGHASMQAGVQYEGAVWRRVLERLDRRRSSREVRPLDEPANPEEAAAAKALDEMEIDELREIARLRRQMAEQAASIAETHRDHVWERVQSRIQAQPQRRWPFTFFVPKRHKPPRSVGRDLLAAAAGDSRFDGERRAGGRSTSSGQATVGTMPGWWKTAAAAALLVLLSVALAPLPATGFDGHPVARAMRSISEHLGVREAPAPPAPPPVTAVVQGSEITAAEASERLGAPVAVPTTPPAGFELTSARFFDQALTADNGGTYALTYTRAGGSSVVIYQERASGEDFAVAGGAATDVALSDGTAGTYVDGMWQQVDGRPAWSPSGGQTLVFERGDVRTTVQYTGPEAEAPSLFALAYSMTAAR